MKIHWPLLISLSLLACAPRNKTESAKLSSTADDIKKIEDALRSGVKGEGVGTAAKLVIPTDPFPGSHQAIYPLVSNYNTDKGLWGDGWWNSATSLTSVIDYMLLSGSNEFIWLVNTTFEKNKGSKFINEFYDDNAWWGLAWLKAYDLTREQKYLDASKAIADQMMNTGWDAKCGGGIYWKADKQNKNAVENELYIKLAAGLHNRLPYDTQYLENAVKTWNWFLASGMINGENLVNDGLRLSDCKNNNDATWTYNQGIILGAAAELFVATSDQAYLNKARDLALSSISRLNTSNAVLKERNDPGCGECKNDERLFKGAYMRNLREINAHLKNDAIESYLDNNSKTAWNKARSSQDWIGFRWEGPFDSLDASRQASALDLFNSRVKRKFAGNIALNRPVATNHVCAASEAGSFAVDGSIKTKWCGVLEGATGAFADIDLGAIKDVHTVRIMHAGAGGELPAMNVADFELLVSDAASGPWTEAVSVRGNTSNATFHVVDRKARFVRMHVTKAGSDNIARVYEIKVD